VDALGFEEEAFNFFRIDEYDCAPDQVLRLVEPWRTVSRGVEVPIGHVGTNRGPVVGGLEGIDNGWDGKDVRLKFPIHAARKIISVER